MCDLQAGRGQQRELASDQQSQQGQQASREEQFGDRNQDALGQQILARDHDALQIQTKLQRTQRLARQFDGQCQVIARRVVVERKTRVNRRQRLASGPAAGGDDSADGIGYRQVIDAANRLAFVQNRLHRGVVVLRQRCHQRCREHRCDLFGLLACLFPHRLVQQAQTVAHQNGQHDQFHQQRCQHQSAAHRAPGSEVHYLACFNTRRTSLA